MNKFYENMPQDFKDAVEVIKRYCQFEDCDCNCEECPYSLKRIRCGDDFSDKEPTSCDGCGSEITDEEYKRNDGYCDECNFDRYEP